MRKSIARALHTRIIFGQDKARTRTSGIANSYGPAIGERRPCYRSIRHYIRLQRDLSKARKYKECGHKQVVQFRNKTIKGIWGA